MAGISDILKKSTDTNYSLTEVMSRALQGRTTFGKALNQIRSEELKARESEAGIDIAKQRMDLAEREFDFNQKKFRAQYADDNAKAFEDRFGFWSEGLSKQDQVSLYNYAREADTPVNRMNADTVLSEGVSRLGLRATPKKETFGHLKAVQGGLYDAKSGQWIVEKKDTKEDVNALKAALAFRATGQDVTNPRAQALSPTDAAQVLTMMKGSGFTVETTTPEGTTTRVTMGGTAPKVTGKHIDTVKEQVQQAQSGLTMVRDAIGKIEANRSRAGLPGTVRRLAQRGVGILKDLDESLGTNLTQLVSDTTRTAAEDIKGERIDQSAAGFFDPALPELDLMENSLAYRLARIHKPGGRLNMQDVFIWKNAVNISGLEDVDSILARLKAVEQLFVDANEDLNTRLEQMGTEGIAVPEETPVEEMTDDEIRKYLEGLQ